MNKNIFEKYPKSDFLRKLPADSDILCLRERIVELFSYLDGLEDSHFEYQLDQDPYARLWEMMVAKILKVEGHEPKSTDQEPDFFVEKDGNRVFIEAICPGPGDDGNPNSVPPIIYNAPVAQRVPIAQIVLRILSALDAKKEKYKKYLDCGIVSPTDICIIALSLSKLRRAYRLNPPIILRATHGLGNQYVIFGTGEGDAEEGIAICESIKKNSGAEIDTRFFLSEENGLFSAVLYSDCSIYSSDFELFAQSMIIYNPKARIALPQGFFKGIDEIRTICCQNNSGWWAYRKKAPNKWNVDE